jgi:hypothetical protein
MMKTGFMMVVWRRRRRAVAVGEKRRVFTEAGMVKERRRPSMKGGVSVERIVGRGCHGRNLVCERTNIMGNYGPLQTGATPQKIHFSRID